LTDVQLYLAIGVPSFVALIGILVNIGYFIALNARMTVIESRLTALEAKVDRHFEIIIGKISELETRVAALETKH
jgi:hypothetical protein